MKIQMLIFFKKNNHIIGFIFLIFFILLLTIYFDHLNKLKEQKYSDFINNIYLKKTINHAIDNLEPKYKRINHQIKSGETFDKILNKYSINKKEIKQIKKILSEKIN